jgi:hypothetical protein
MCQPLAGMSPHRGVSQVPRALPVGLHKFPARWAFVSRAPLPVLIVVFLRQILRRVASLSFHGTKEEGGQCFNMNRYPLFQSQIINSQYNPSFTLCESVNLRDDEVGNNQYEESAAATSGVGG